jgi:hypothetical protein
LRSIDVTFDELAVLLNGHPSRCVGAGASEAEIEQAERELNVLIKGDFRRFLRTFGWGGVGPLELYGLGSDVPSYLNLVQITKSEHSEMMPKLARELLPLMNDGGGNLYCLDTASEEPVIVFWDHEGSESQQPETVASDFVAWMSEMIGQIE